MRAKRFPPKNRSKRRFWTWFPSSASGGEIRTSDVMSSAGFSSNLATWRLVFMPFTGSGTSICRISKPRSFSALLFVGGMVGFLVWGMVGDRFGARNIQLASDLMQTAVLVIVLVSPSIWVFNLIFLIYGFAQSGYMIGEMLMGMGLGPESERSLYLGLVRTIPGLFVLVAPLIGGAIVEAVNYPMMFFVALVLGVNWGGIVAWRQRPFGGARQISEIFNYFV